MLFVFSHQAWELSTYYSTFLILPVNETQPTTAQQSKVVIEQVFVLLHLCYVMPPTKMVVAFLPSRNKTDVVER